MEQGYVTLLANRAGKVTRDGALPRHVLVVDELAHYLLPPTARSSPSSPSWCATGALGEVLARAADPDRWQWREAQIRYTGYCRRPVRLTGQILTVDEGTGEIHTVSDTRREPDEVLLKACGSRRATVCPPCSEVYRADSWQLVAAGLRGGKGIPQCPRRCAQARNRRAWYRAGVLPASGPRPQPQLATKMSAAKVPFGQRRGDERPVSATVCPGGACRCLRLWSRGVRAFAGWGR